MEMLSLEKEGGRSGRNTREGTNTVNYEEEDLLLDDLIKSFSINAHRNDDLM
jgi:hypothetical protein